VALRHGAGRNHFSGTPGLRFRGKEGGTGKCPWRHSLKWGKGGKRGRISLLSRKKEMGGREKLSAIIFISISPVSDEKGKERKTSISIQLSLLQWKKKGTGAFISHFLEKKKRKKGKTLHR